MPQPSTKAIGRPTPASLEHQIRGLAGSLDAVVHTHTPRVPYRGDSDGAVTDLAALSAKRMQAAFIASTTTEGAYRLAISPPGGAGAIGVAMAVGNDIGLPDGRTLLDLALDGDTAVIQETGLSLGTAEALCREAAALVARAPSEPLSDQPVLFFEADDEEVAITPLVSVRVLQQINARLSDVDRSSQARFVLRIAQGGSQPQNIAHYVNASRRREGDTWINRNSVRGAYNALRVRCPDGMRSPVQRDLARIIATRSLAAACQVGRAGARDFRSRAVTGLLLPGAAVRLATIRAAERRDASVIARQYLARLREIRSYLRRRGNKHGYRLDRLPAPALAWLLRRADRDDVVLLSAHIAEALIGAIERAASGALPPAARNVLRAAMTEALEDAS